MARDRGVANAPYQVACKPRDVRRDHAMSAGIRKAIRRPNARHTPNDVIDRDQMARGARVRASERRRPRRGMRRESGSGPRSTRARGLASGLEVRLPLRVMRQPTSSDPVARAIAGMRRVDAVRVVEGTRVRFYVEGIGHRLPTRREISATVASALMQQVPTYHDWRATRAEVAG